MADLYSLFMHFLPKRGIIDSERGEIPMKLIFLGAAHEVTGSCMLLEAAGRTRGFLISGGAVDTQRMAAALLDGFRAGKLGRITLELPGEEPA